MTFPPTHPNRSNLQAAALVAVRILRANRKSYLHIMILSPTHLNLSNLQGAALVAVRILRAYRNIRSLRTATRAAPCKWIFKDEP